MRLLWLTPVHRRSAIARFSELVVDRLIAKGCDVAVGASEVSFDPAERRPFLDLPISSASLHLRNADAFDAVVANFGDHYPNHGRSLDALFCPAVIGIFHDADMINFGNGMRADGRSLAGLADNASGSEVTSAIAQQCGGAIIHSNFYRNLADACDGPVAVVPLAWSRPPETLGEQLPDQAREGFSIVTFGNINTNKCADRVIEAIAASSVLSQTGEYRLIGAIEPAIEKHLRQLAEQRGVKLIIRGPVSDSELVRELNMASVVSCLREPVLEGASASAIEAMMQGCAVMVSNAGFYADLPDDCVAKVTAATDVASIQNVLEELHADSDGLRELRKRARAYSSSTFSPAKYADAVLRLVADVRVTSAYLPLIDRIALQMSALNVSADSPASEYLLQSLEGMVPASRRSD